MGQRSAREIRLGDLHSILKLTLIKLLNLSYAIHIDVVLSVSKWCRSRIKTRLWRNEMRPQKVERLVSDAFKPS